MAGIKLPVFLLYVKKSSRQLRTEMVLRASTRGNSQSWLVTPEMASAALPQDNQIDALRDLLIDVVPAVGEFVCVHSRLPAHLLRPIAGKPCN